MGTETKSGRVIKTPGKFSACVTGKRKLHKNRKMESENGFPFKTNDDFVADETATSSMAVNTSTCIDDPNATELDETVLEYDDGAMSLTNVYVDIYSKSIF